MFPFIRLFLVLIALPVATQASTDNGISTPPSELSTLELIPTCPNALIAAIENRVLDPYELELLIQSEHPLSEFDGIVPSPFVVPLVGIAGEKHSSTWLGFALLRIALVEFLDAHRTEVSDQTIVAMLEALINRSPNTVSPHDTIFAQYHSLLSSIFDRSQIIKRLRIMGAAYRLGKNITDVTDILIPPSLGANQSNPWHWFWWAPRFSPDDPVRFRRLLETINRPMVRIESLEKSLVDSPKLTLAEAVFVFRAFEKDPVQLQQSAWAALSAKVINDLTRFYTPSQIATIWLGLPEQFARTSLKFQYQAPPTVVRQVDPLAVLNQELSNFSVLPEEWATVQPHRDFVKKIDLLLTEAKFLSDGTLGRSWLNRMLTALDQRPLDAFNNRLPRGAFSKILELMPVGVMWVTIDPNASQLGIALQSRFVLNGNTLYINKPPGDRHALELSTEIQILYLLASEVNLQGLSYEHILSGFIAPLLSVVGRTYRWEELAPVWQPRILEIIQTAISDRIL